MNHEEHFFVGERGKANLEMYPLNGGNNGVAAYLTTNQGKSGFTQAIFQFDDGFVAEGNGGMTSSIMLNTIRGKTQLNAGEFQQVPEKDVIWTIDSRCGYPGPARGFLAFQKRVTDRAIELLCMGMKKEFRESPDDQFLFMPTVVLAPEGQSVTTEEYPYIFAPEKEWQSLTFLVTRLYQTTLTRKGKVVKSVSLGYALDHSKQFFMEELEPQSRARIKSVFHIE